MTRPMATTALLTFATTSTALAAIPPMPGMTSGLGMPGNGMIHAEIAVQNNTVSAVLRDGPSGGATPDNRLVAGPAAAFDPPYNVLSNRLYNAQYGWLEDQTIGFTPIDITPDESIWIELLSTAGPGTVNIYEGGNGQQLTATGHTMAPIHGTAGSPAAWQWDDDFLMQHNWYTFSTPGDYDLTFNIYVGDNNGASLSTYTPAQLILTFTAIPEPGSAALLLPLAALTRRRSH
ncbi:hypothetical protein [Mucisphaera sp.]|uniref:hypothetical protein n=1 Tax=Mucisphaera sp. TaxID=2913024 RepID=UPI003D14ED5B